MIYLDYNATTPPAPEVVSAISSALEHAWGNPSSAYCAGKTAKTIIEDARTSIGRMIGASASDVIFTSGGTEANNMVIHSAVEYFHSFDDKSVFEGSSETKRLPHIITTNVEHDSIALPLKMLYSRGKIEVTFVRVSPDGSVKVTDIMAAVRHTTCLISVMMANNEIGTVQPVRGIADALATHHTKWNPEMKILLHTDAAQTIGKIPVNVQELGVDFLTVVGHKFYGPRIGALFVKNLDAGAILYPMFYGGGQERHYRPGTENTGMIAGLGKAAELVLENLGAYQDHMESTRNYLEQQLQLAFPGRVQFNGKYEDVERLPNTCNVSILGEQLEGTRLLQQADNLQASVGAACHSDKRSEPSPILLAIGVEYGIAKNAIRLSVGRETTRGDIDTVVASLCSAVHRITAVYNVMCNK